MSFSCTSLNNGFGFSPGEITETVARKGLLTMEIEFSLACNFSCPYCYNIKHNEDTELDAKKIDEVLHQARKQGARKIIILGGEPMIYPEIHDKIRFIREQSMEVELFTNGSCMTLENARFMHQHDVAVVLKMNSFNPELQNRMAGREDASEIIHNAYQNLAAAGYPAPGKRLAVSTVICEQNIQELPDLWRWLRRRNIEPYFEMITPQGGAADREWGCASAERQKQLFQQLAEIDRISFGREWEPQPPLVGNVCLRHQFSCLVNAKGQVMPCVGVTIPLGSIYEQTLAEILEQSEVLDKMRDFPNRIKGGCRTCGKADHCYGCRGTAYQLTGDYLASDPTCWLNQGEPVESLPVDTEPFVPHQKPILCVDKLVEVGERKARLQAEIKNDSPFLDENGFLDESLYVEMVAQGIAATEGFHATSEEREKHQGLLMSIKNFKTLKPARVGDQLDIQIEKIGFFEDFGVVEGTVTRDRELLAQGQISIYRAISPGAARPRA